MATLRRWVGRWVDGSRHCVRKARGWEGLDKGRATTHDLEKKKKKREKEERDDDKKK